MPFIRNGEKLGYFPVNSVFVSFFVQLCFVPSKFFGGPEVLEGVLGWVGRMGAVNSDVPCIQCIFAFVMKKINKEISQEKVVWL